MRAVRSAPPGVEVVDVADPGGDEGVVTVRSASICASDLLYIGWGLRMVLGHELAGTTVDGAPVAVEAMFGCGTCEWCRRGRFNLCQTMSDRALGVSIDGGMSEYFTVPPGSQVPLPPGLDVRDACLVEPTAVAWHGVRVGGVGPDTAVGVVGGGAIGLLAAAAALAQGAPAVGLEARHPHQIEAGERLGATRPTGGYDVVIEAGGSESSLQRSIELIRPEGTVVILGVFNPGTPFPFVDALTREARVVSSIGYCRYDGGRDFEDAAGLLAGSPDLVATVITHRFPLEDAAEAFRVAADKSSGATRVVLEPSTG
jgi:2-desacetyl-2-hydroxyethyl bacteriochlorophyllide A dehydrogenase